MATLKEVQAKIAKLQSQAEEIITKQSSNAIKQIRDLMAKHGLTIADIETRALDRGRGSKLEGKVSHGAAKYRDPKSGATWTGRGRAPRWIAGAKDRSSYLISGFGTEAGFELASKRRNAGSVTIKARRQGKAAAKYRHPKTGEKSKPGAAKAGTTVIAAKRMAAKKPKPHKVAVKKVAARKTASTKSASRRLSADSGMAGDARQMPIRMPTIPDRNDD